MASEPLSRDQLIALSDDELLRACQVDRYRASGPGGQKRNKTESAIRIRHVPTGVSAHADDQRSQHANKRKAVRRLRAKFAIELREDIVDGSAPSTDLADIVRLGPPGKAQRDKPAYLTAIAHLLDRCHAADYRIGDAAKALSTNTSSIAKIVTADPRILRRVNEERTARNQKPLR